MPEMIAGPVRERLPAAFIDVIDAFRQAFRCNEASKNAYVHCPLRVGVTMTKNKEWNHA